MSSYVKISDLAGAGYGEDLRPRRRQQVKLRRPWGLGQAATPAVPVVTATPVAVASAPVAAIPVAAAPVVVAQPAPAPVPAVALAPVAAPAPVQIPAPLVTGISPVSGGVGLYVTITGANLSGATSVTFNGTPASFTVNSANQITATTPQGMTSGPVVVTTPGGSATAPNSFSVVLPTPAITQFSPTSGSAGTYVTIFGANFNGVTSVTFNNVPAQSFVVNSSGQITAVVPAGQATGVVGVATQGGYASSTASFTAIGSASAASYGVLVQQATDAALNQYGLPDNSPATYTPDRLNAIFSIVTSKGVDPSQAPGLIRQEVYRRLLLDDPYPTGDLIDLSTRLSALAQQAQIQAQQVQQSQIQQAQPMPLPLYQPPAPMQYTAPAPAPTPTPPQPAVQPAGRRRVPGSDFADKHGLPSWVPMAAGAVVGGVALFGILNAFSSRRDAPRR